jgi:glutamine---fructose-6-phosphate transaminase (isomerizing)
MSKTYQEIMQQPAIWDSVLATATSEWDSIGGRLDLAADVQLIFTGSGTSYYLAQAAAQGAQEVTGRPARAVPSADVFLSPASTVPDGVPLLVFVISRSGRTSEALLAVDFLKAQRPLATVVAVSCVAGSPLAERAHEAIELDQVREQSVVMTQSFSSMLLALQAVAAAMAGDGELLAELRHLPAAADSVMPKAEEFAERLGTERALSKFVYLGIGPYFGLAEEAMLKLTEMTQTWSAAYNSLEFRHGPISTVDRGTAAVLLCGRRELDYVEALIRDLAHHGVFVAAIGPDASTASVDLDLTLPGELGDIARSVLYMPALQLIAYHRASVLGLDADAPRNLGHVVVLESNTAGTP